LGAKAAANADSLVRLRTTSSISSMAPINAEKSGDRELESSCVVARPRSTLVGAIEEVAQRFETTEGFAGHGSRQGDRKRLRGIGRVVSDEHRHARRGSDGTTILHCGSRRAERSAPAAKSEVSIQRRFVFIA